MKITGELLKSERVSKGLSIQEVAQTLKLSRKIITEIEAGNAEALPAKTFVRGFVKSYAQLLKLDTDVVLRQFQEEMGSTTPLPKVPPPRAGSVSAHAPPAPSGAPGSEAGIKAPRPNLKQTSQSHSNKPPTPPGEFLKSENPQQVLLLIGAACVLVALLVLANKTFEHFSQNPVAIAEPSTEPATSGTVPPAEIEAQAQTSPLSQDNTVGAIPDSATITQNIVDTESVPEPGFTKSTGKPVEVIIEAKKETEVFYAKGTAKQLISLKLAANHVQVLRSNVGLYLKSNEPSAIRLSVNGTDIAPASASQKEMKLSF